MKVVDADLRDQPLSGPRGPALAIGVLTTGHFFTDFYAQLFPPLLVLFQVRFDLSVREAALVAAVVAVIGPMMQPLLGVLADRVNRVFLAGTGVMLAALGMSAVGLAPNVWLLVLFLLVGGIGVSTFHPASASVVTKVNPRRAGFLMALFMAGGHLGVAAGPLVGTWLAKSYGVEQLWILCIPGILMASVLYSLALRRRQHSLFQSRTVFPKFSHLWSNQKGKVTGSLASLFSQGTGKIWALWFLAVLRALVFASFFNFISYLGKEKGWDIAQSGRALSLFLVCAPIGGLVGGYIGDRFNPKVVLSASCLLAVPFLWLFVHSDPNTGFGLAAFMVAGIMFSLGNPLVVTMAQKLRPESAAAMTGLMMGTAWAGAGLLIPIVGASASVYGFTNSLGWVSLAPLVAALIAVFLPNISIERKLPL